jgi:hypothetical protein
VEHLVDDRVEQLDVVADDDEPAGVLGRKPRSQVIESASRWLVGSSSSSVVASRTGCGRARCAALPAGQRAELLARAPLGQAEVRADAGASASAA